MPWEGDRVLSRLSRKKMFFQASLIWIFALTLFFMSVPGVAGALEITVSPTGSNNDQTVINNALEAVHNSGGGKVYLNAGTYKVDNTVIIGSNTILTGAPDAVIMVSPTSSQWFTGSVGIISCEESVKKR
jgi:polygalacturonase